MKTPLLCRTVGHRFVELDFPLVNPPWVCKRCGLKVRRSR